jgi:hypothetical protein
MASRCPVPVAEEGRVNDAEKGLISVDEPESHRAQRNPVDEVDSPVNRIKDPVHVRVAGRSGFLTDEADVRRLLLKVVSYESFDGQLDLGHQIAITFGLNFAGFVAHQEVDRLVHGAERNVKQACCVKRAHRDPERPSDEIWART